MAQPANGSKELNLNKPDTFDGDQEKFRKFLQDIEVYLLLPFPKLSNPQLFGIAVLVT
jgi:hypothetical protein